MYTKIENSDLIENGQGTAYQFFAEKVEGHISVVYLFQVPSTKKTDA